MSSTPPKENIGSASSKIDGDFMDQLRDKHAKVQLADFLMAMVPDNVQGEDSWKYFKKSVQVDTMVRTAIETSRKATREPALYAPFATIANQTTKLFK
ncbi:hypothetical protein FRB93_003837 [Tulasnella sp. JGI-2019a]|nr:hypothetical protein FRB93_003837 [Tulasnella sp. JGI-2019a]